MLRELTRAKQPLSHPLRINPVHEPRCGSLYKDFGFRKSKGGAGTDIADMETELMPMMSGYG